MAIILIFALIAATLFSAMYLAGGAAQSLDRGTRWFGADLTVIPENSSTVGEGSLLTGNPAMFFFNGAVVENVSRIPGVARASPQILVATLAGASCCSDFLQIIAVNPEKDFTLLPWLNDHPGVTLDKDGIIVGSRIEGDIHSLLIFYGHSYHIVGRIEPTGMRSIDKAVFIRMEDAHIMADESGTKAVKPLVLPPGMISSVLVQMDPGASSVAVEDAIIREVPDTRILTRASLSGTVTQHLAGITLLLHDIAVIVTAIFLPVLVFVSVMLARDMKQELTILGALGATKAFVLRLILAETFSAALIGSLAGIGSALVVLFGFQDFIALSLNVPFSVPTAVDLLSAAGSTLVLTLVISGIASLYPTFRLLRSEAYGNIRTDESD